MMRDIQNINDDISGMKRQIKQTLIADTDILETLHSEIDIDSPDEFLDTHIFGFIRIPNTQDTVRNFICVTVDDIEEHRFNEVMKVQNITFTVICHLSDMKTQYGVDRHDLLGYLIRESINWTNLFGLQFKLIYNKESTIDGDYYCRTLKFEAIKPNSLNNARMANPRDKLRR
jgi:hypothetical protein